jgi:hypothetical protein
MSRKNPISLIYASAILGAAIVGCVSDHAERVYINLPASISPPTILAKIPTQPFDVVADIQWVGRGDKKMVERAKKLGGDAVIVQYLGGNVLLSSLTGEQANATSTTFSRMSGTVIKYKTIQ